MKKIVLAVVVIVTLLFVGNYFVKSPTPVADRNPVPSPAPTERQLIGGDKDIHGCLGAAGYSWCESKNKCLRVWEEACSTSIGLVIQSLLAKKYDKPIDEVNINVVRQDGDYVSGGVMFGPGGPGEGGVWLAAKINNDWQVVYDGNGSIDCTKMRQEYGFPDTILKPNFCD